MKPFVRQNPARRGFTLLEISVVLGVIGIVLAGIWTAATSVSHSAKVEKAQEELFTIVQNIRDANSAASNLGYLYGCSTTVPLGACATTHTDITATLVTNGGIFPQEMITGAGNVVNPWGGDVHVFAAPDTVGTYAGNYTEFEIQFYSAAGIEIPNQDMCNLLTSISNDAIEKGLFAVHDDAPYPTNWIDIAQNATTGAVTYTRESGGGLLSFPNFTCAGGNFATAWYLRN